MLSFPSQASRIIFFHLPDLAISGNPFPAVPDLLFLLPGISFSEHLPSLTTVWKTGVHKIHRTFFPHHIEGQRLI